MRLITLMHLTSYDTLVVIYNSYDKRIFIDCAETYFEDEFYRQYDQYTVHFIDNEGEAIKLVVKEK